jgi:hypothetical protein
MTSKNCLEPPCILRKLCSLRRRPYLDVFTLTSLPRRPYGVPEALQRYRALSLLILPHAVLGWIISRLPDAGPVPVLSVTSDRPSMP